MVHIISYDISDNKRRGKIASLLLDWGERVQLSVFEAELKGRDIEELQQAIKKILVAEDSLRIYPVCAGCCGKMISMGPSHKKNCSEGWYI